MRKIKFDCREDDSIFDKAWAKLALEKSLEADKNKSAMTLTELADELERKGFYVSRDLMSDNRLRGGRDKKVIDGITVFEESFYIYEGKEQFANKWLVGTDSLLGDDFETLDKVLQFICDKYL